MNTHDKYDLPPLPEPLCNLPTYCQDAIRQYTRSILDDQDAAIEAAFASPEVQALRKDSERLEFLIAEECQVKTMTSLRKGKWYHLYWPDLEEMQNEWFTNPRAAIDAAMEK